MSEKKDDKTPEKDEPRPRGESSPSEESKAIVTMVAETIKTMETMRQQSSRQPALPDPDLFRASVPGGIYGIRNHITGRVDEYCNCHGDAVDATGKPIEE